MTGDVPGRGGSVSHSRVCVKVGMCWAGFGAGGTFCFAGSSGGFAEQGEPGAL